MSKAFCWFVKITGWLPYVVCMRPKVRYLDKRSVKRAMKGKAVIMPDHHSVWDVAAMMFTFPRRNLHCVVAELMFNKSRFFAWFLKAIGSIRVDRNDHDFAFITEAGRVLDGGGVVEIYPEARIPKMEEQTPLPFAPSVSYIALMGGAPIIPVVTSGNYFTKKRLRVLVGKPIDIAELWRDDLSEKENIDSITNQLREKIIELKNELETR